MLREDLAALLERDDTVSDVESQVYRKDGSIIWTSENIRAVKDDMGRIVHYEGTVSDITERRQTEVALRLARKKSELLLLNTLPQAIAERLKKGQRTIAESFEEVTVMFADLVDFTKYSAQTSPTELVEMLNVIFSKFDQLAEHHGLEKIKTIGDAYMVVAGLPTARRDHAQAIAEMALDMQEAIAQYNTDTGQAFKIRIGINSGPVVAGVIGIKKFSYDLWGDTVNIASRMESQGIPSCIQVTAATYERLRDRYLFEERKPIQVKGKGEMTTYILKDRIWLDLSEDL
jgi:class 3 adenylate cyclase